MPSPSIATSSGAPVCWIGPWLMSCQLMPTGIMGDAPVARGELLGIVAVLQECGEHRPVGLEGRGVHVGDVVGDDFQLALQRGLARQANEKGAFSID